MKTLVIFTRFPEPGKVKSRLMSALGDQGAADLQMEMTRHAVMEARSAMKGEGWALEVHFEGGDEHRMQELYGDDLNCIRQRGRDLGERMHSAIRYALRSGTDAAVLLGTDCPGISGALIRKAFSVLDDTDCVIGPAIDGGYYLIGMRRDMPEVFEAVPWGTNAVLGRTIDVLKRLSMSWALLDELSDVDRPEDLHVWEETRKTSGEPMISVVIPVLNEGHHIGKTLGKALKGRNVEVVVVDGGSMDDTFFQAARTGARVVTSGRGRAVQMNRGAEETSGDILLFVHGDTMLPDGYDNLVRAALADGQAAAGAFSLSFDNSGPGMKVIAFGANLRSRILGLPYGDQAIFLKRGTFREAGGFQEVPIMEDIAFMRSVKGRGKILVLAEHVITSGRRYSTLGPFRTWVLNQLALAGYFLGMPLEDLADLYRHGEPSPGTWARRIVKAFRDRRSMA
ncbi:MAG: TIGR04283 family arsenosugar biosynthesis glycosyltransferase [Desulfobacterota bacterium]|nr:TIGR04283 family arsenosugar biosynthesis glycosyltransferase [Thermodesulfobacteriota bacterium]